MNKFLSKLQYKHYETGEFIDEKERTEQEIIDLIKNFPWAEQCHNTPVGLTAPSVTIENALGMFLKISHSYYSKFSIYLLNDKGNCFKKVVPDINEAIIAVNEFCSDLIREDSFQHEVTFHPKKHFVTKQFIYHFNGAGAATNIILFSLYPIGLLALSLFILFEVNFHSGSTQISTSGWKIALYCLAPLVVMAILLYYTILSCRLYWNHYTKSKGLFIEISQGKNDFRFGTESDNKVYQKDKIALIRIYQNNQRRSPWEDIQVIEINFNYREQIVVSSLLLHKPDFPRETKIEYISTFYPKIS